METNSPDDPVEVLTATPASIRRLNELTLILREQLPAAMDRLETDTTTLQRVSVELSEASKAMRGCATAMRDVFNHLIAQSQENLDRLASAHLRTLSAYSRGVTLLLVSQAVLTATTVLLLWIRR